ncbi:MAG: response regulator [Candidatus Sulfotelmatobacter sp.]
MDSLASIEHGPRPSAAEAPAAVEQMVAAQALMGGPLAHEYPLRREQQILLVEDEAFVRRVTGEVLESAGYRLQIAGNAAEALQVCRSSASPMNLLLTDVVLPGMNGRDLANEVSALYPGIRVLLISGYAEQLALSATSDDGPQCLAKPFSAYTLLSRVRQMLEKSCANSTSANL